ncbi:MULTISPECIES: AAA family ATPase [Streptococcus]|jgi:yga2G|uniref:AAA family ATPase n=1 Tax=Streptococcus TaxID=1301 RepID=UPI0005E985A9|nr:MULTISPECIES: AAA family ATPase [Streptococcus]HER0070721.1 AAA family ATPase [Streptococcus pyogenes]MBZ2090323.1 AAA family ATPase [Streptococcus parasanguinis]UJD01879.1 AAA family ATPase [Streptococcus oralis]CEV46937.1 Yga2G [Streptococcus pneumoniae]CEX28955.1 Yga2G [Streptococcus pneumoniae]
MKLTKVIINNFRSFGESQIIELNNQTVLIGNNSSGKTTVLQALSKLFSDKQNDRIIKKSDFHLPKGSRPGENTRNLFIETIFEFDELDGTPYSPAIPSFFEHFTVSKDGAKPFLRIRLESSWEDDGTVEGSIDTQFYYISSDEDTIRDEDKHRAPRKDLDKIRVLYVPASRTPEKELGNASGSMLSRLVNSINWTEDEINEITDKIDELNNTFLSENGALNQINNEIQKSWELYHEDNRFSQAELIINSSEMAAALRQIALKFSPTTTEEAFTVSDLGDGLRSIFYFSLVDSILDIELEITKDREENPNNPRFKLIPPVLTILAIEEPENHIAPHHIGKLIKRFKQLGNNDNSQVILTSHSPAIVKRIDPEDLKYLRIENNDRVLQTIVSDIQLPLAIDESYKYIKGAIQAYPELYFAKLVVLGEGDSEELLLPKFFDLLGKEVDSSQISIVPLGGRHVNYFWKLLNALRIPHITLLDFDNERYGGGWGRIKYISQHLYELNTEFQEWFNTQRLDFNEIGSRGCESIGAQRLINWFNKLEEFNVYFSSPLDIDFLMLQHYKDNYLNTLSPIEGPVVSYNDSDGSSKKVKLSDLDCLDRLQLEGFNKRKEEAIRATLKDKSGSGDSFTEEEKKLMIWYQYFFLGRGKPTTHMQFLSSISDDELTRNLPPVFEKMVKRAEELLGDIEHDEE